VRYRLSNHPEVPRDFERILKFIGSYAGYSLAQRKTSEIKQFIDKLKDRPHVGTVRNEIVHGLRALPVAEKATVCFTVDDETHTVKIVCVTYAGQDWRKIAAERENQDLSRNI